jgi:DNA-binding LacI/PurR family transcriptional regulator
LKKAQDLHTKIYFDLYNLIASAGYNVGDRIPTELSLSTKYKVSRPTIHKAVRRLQEEGYLESKAGSGTRITHKPRRNDSSLVFGLLFPFRWNMEGLFNPLSQEIASLSTSLDFQIVWGGKFPKRFTSSQDLDRMADFYINQKVSGVFLAPIELTADCMKSTNRIAQRLTDANIPIVLIDADFYPFPGNSNYDFVGIDNYRAAYHLTEHFINKGETRVDFCSNPFSGETVQLRLKGIKGALMDHGITPSSDWIHTIDENKKDFGKELKKKGVRNIICSNDWVALRLMKMLHEDSYLVPKDFRLAGFDNSIFSQNSNPQLTSIDQQCHDLAALAVKAMLNRIKDPLSPALRLFSNFSLKERASTL